MEPLSTSASTAHARELPGAVEELEEVAHAPAYCAERPRCVLVCFFDEAWAVGSRCCETFAPAEGLLRAEGDWLVVPTAAPVRPVRGAMVLCAHTVFCIGLWGSFWLFGRRWVCRCRCRRRRHRVCSCACRGCKNSSSCRCRRRCRGLASPLLSAGRRDAAVWTSRLRSGIFVWRHVLRSYVPLDQLPARFRTGRSGWHKTKFSRHGPPPPSSLLARGSAVAARSKRRSAHHRVHDDQLEQRLRQQFEELVRRGFRLP
jgi:hypothetical protein